MASVPRCPISSWSSLPSCPPLSYYSRLRCAGAFGSQRISKISNFLIFLQNFAQPAASLPDSRGQTSQGVTAGRGLAICGWARAWTEARGSACRSACSSIIQCNRVITVKKVIRLMRSPSLCKFRGINVCLTQRSLEHSGLKSYRTVNYTAIANQGWAGREIPDGMLRRG